MINSILARLLSYFSIFILGAYTCSAIRYHDSPELYRWILTSAFGVFFYYLSLPEKNKQ
jgi:hypothetical protein